MAEHEFWRENQTGEPPVISTTNGASSRISRNCDSAGEMQRWNQTQIRSSHLVEFSFHTAMRIGPG